MNRLALVTGLIWISFGCSHKVEMSEIKMINDSIDVIWDLEALSKPPEYELTDDTSKVRELFYRGPDFLNDKTKVFAFYSNPEILKTGKNNPNNEYPGIVLIHGGGGKAYKHWVEKWAAQGYAAIAMDLSGNDRNQKRLADGGPEQSRENKFQTVKEGVEATWTYYHAQSIIKAHSLLLSFPEVDPDKTVVTGISWGGYLTCIVASIDSRFKAACPVYGCGFFRELAGAAEDLMNLDTGSKEKWTRSLDPQNYLTYAKQPFLFINGNKDGFFDIFPFHKTYSLIPKSNRNIRITPNMIHSHRHGWEPLEIHNFFNNILFDDFDLPRITTSVSREDTIYAEYTSPVGLRIAGFYYSNDTSNTNRERIWKRKKAKISENLIKVEVPEESYEFGFLYITDHRGLSTSSELMIR